MDQHRQLFPPGRNEDRAQAQPDGMTLASLGKHLARRSALVPRRPPHHPALMLADRAPGLVAASNHLVTELADDFLGLPSQQAFRRRVPENDPLLGVDGERAVGGLREELEDASQDALPRRDPTEREGKLWTVYRCRMDESNRRSRRPGESCR